MRTWPRPSGFRFSAEALEPVVSKRSAPRVAFGSLVEMGLIALGLKMSILYVTAHHLLRIILAVSVARAFGRRVG